MKVRPPTDKYLTYFRAQLTEAETRRDSPYMKGFRNAMKTVIRTFETDQVGIFSAGSDEVYEG